MQNIPDLSFKQQDDFIKRYYEWLKERNLQQQDTRYACEVTANPYLRAIHFGFKDFLGEWEL